MIRHMPTPPGQSDRRAHPAGSGGTGPRRVAVKGISTQSGNVAQRASSRLITAPSAWISTPESERSAAWSHVPRARRHEHAHRGRSGHEDAERVPCQVGERVQGLVGIVSPIEQNHCTQGHRALPLPLPLELGAARNSEIEVQLLWHSWRPAAGRRPAGRRACAVHSRLSRRASPHHRASRR